MSAICKKGCNRRLKCGHACVELCCLPCKSNCACDKEFESVDQAVTLTAAPEEPHAQPYRDIPQSTQSLELEGCASSSETESKTIEIQLTYTNSLSTEL